MKVSPMYHIVRRIILLLAVRNQWGATDHLPVLPASNQHAFRLSYILFKIWAQAKPMKKSSGIGWDLDPCANLFKAFGLFVYSHFVIARASATAVEMPPRPAPTTITLNGKPVPSEFPFTLIPPFSRRSESTRFKKRRQLLR